VDQSWHLFGEDPSRRHRPTMVEIAHHLGIRVERNDIINIRPVRTGQRHPLGYQNCDSPLGQSSSGQ